MKQRKGLLVVLLIAGVVLVGLAGYFYYKNSSQNSSSAKESTQEKGKEENATTEEEESTAISPGIWFSSGDDITEEEPGVENTAEESTSATAEKKSKKKQQKLPKDYVWDAERWGGTPQIIYDFAEYQEKLEYIVTKVDSVVAEEDGFSTGYDNGSIYYDSGYKKMKDITTKEFKKNVEYILNNTQFYELTKDRGGRWFIEYNQEEDREHYIYIMVYQPGLTDEEAFEEGYYRVVGDWFFGTDWKI